MVRGKIRELNSQKNIKAVTKKNETRIGAVDLSDRSQKPTVASGSRQHRRQNRDWRSRVESG